MPNDTLFHRKNKKIFLKKLFASKTFSHLFPSGEGIWGTVILKKGKKIARHCWQAYFLYLKSCLFHINLQKSLILDEH